MSRMSEVQKRNLAFIFMLCVILMLAVLLVWNLMGNKGENKNSAEGAASSSSAPSDGGQQSSVPSSNATGRGDHKCDVPVAPDKAFSGEAPSDYQFKTSTVGIVYPVSASAGPTYTPAVVGYCFAHNPAGAAMAAAQVTAVMGDSRASGEELKGLFSASVRESLDMSAAKPVRDTRIAGYEVEQYSPERAKIGVVVLVTREGESKQTAVKFTLPLVWENDDWKVDVNPDTVEPVLVTRVPGQVFKANGGKG
ncbi:hypothetical protein [Rothia aeria]|uniref:hypothetical protein n=1 Tax=Rothia aeria TaxID=172042 RepID=UPI00051DA4D1|nr:hypothetical protein [Rothia aeria]KGJ00233.1 hypothetical protein ES20_06780 [Rothia aeria]KGJ34841.1 hypothetical protein ES18_03165 [Rothia aeria]